MCPDLIDGEIAADLTEAHDDGKSETRCVRKCQTIHGPFWSFVSMKVMKLMGYMGCCCFFLIKEQLILTSLQCLSHFGGFGSFS